MSILISTINYNTPDMVDKLVDEIKRSDVDYELMVVDNGSTVELPRSTTHTLDSNYQYGGGVRAIQEYFLSSNHEYVVILNSDLLFHGEGFFKQSIREMQSGNFDLYTPSIINFDYTKLYWRQMWNWGSGIVRSVEWIDYQCPFYTKKLANLIMQYPIELVTYGLDYYGSIIAHINGLNIGVSDTNTIAHLNSYTVKNTNIDLVKYCDIADRSMFQYFLNSEYSELFYKLRNYGETYKYDRNK